MVYINAIVTPKNFFLLLFSQHNYSYEDTKVIIDTETSVTSESALLIFKPEIIDNLWNHIRLLRPNSNKQIHKKHRYIIYCKHCLLEDSYETIININFRYYLSTKHNIIIKKHQNITLAATLDKLNRLYNKLHMNNQIEKFEIKILKKILY